MQPMILPMVLTIAESQDKHEFESSTLPALVAVLTSASGETLLLLVKHADLIINKTGQKDLASHVLPMLVRAYDDADPRIQEEVLKKTVALTKHLDSQLVKQAVVPRVHALALKTTVAAVRVNSLLCLGELIHPLDKQAVLDVLQTIQRCTAVDRSQPTLMCALSIANAVLKQYGTEFVAEHVLSLLSPLLTTQQLNVQQFAKYMAFFKDILRKIEEKRGVFLSDSGNLEVNDSSGPGTHLEPSQEMNRTVSVSAVKKSASWDEDWPDVNKTDLSTQSYTGNASSMRPSIKPDIALLVNGASLSSHSSLKVVGSDSQLMTSSPSIDIEWPPRTSSGSSIPQNDDERYNQSKSTKSFDDVDPFADWPPRPSNSGVLNNDPAGISTSNHASSSSSNFFDNSNLQNLNLQQTKQYQGGLGFNNFPFESGLASGQPLGSLKHSQSNFGTVSYHSSKIATDIGSIFAPPMNDNNAPRLAPPPSIVVGRGRGRGRGAHGQSGRTRKTNPEQPSLLDLL